MKHPSEHMDSRCLTVRLLYKRDIRDRVSAEAANSTQWLFYILIQYYDCVMNYTIGITNEAFTVKRFLKKALESVESSAAKAK
jgi:hypothetical protein